MIMDKPSSTKLVLQHFRDFDRSRWQGTSPLAQWVGKVQKRYNAYVRWATIALRHGPCHASIERAVAELKKLAKLRLYEMRRIHDDFDVNGDGPGNADFICTNACAFLYSMYKARFTYVMWQCMHYSPWPFPNVIEPSGIIASDSDVISNKMLDKPAHIAFCNLVEASLHSTRFSDLVLGPNAHAWFLSINDENLYAFQASWVNCDMHFSGHACAPIHCNDPEVNYWPY